MFDCQKMWGLKKWCVTKVAHCIWHVASSSRLTKFVETYDPVAENETASAIKVLYIVYIENILKRILVRY